MCEGDPCSSCEACSADTCRRIDRKSHPDVHYLAPEGAQATLSNKFASLSPIPSWLRLLAGIRCISSIGSTHLVRRPRTRFLKTLEEPPDDVTIILLGRTREAVLPTIVSRCQVVPFRHIPASEASGILAQNTGCTLPEAAIAIQAVGGSITKAAQFLRSKERGVFRTKIIGAMGSLLRADDLDILEYARDLVLASKTPLDEVRREQERDLEEKAEFLQLRLSSSLKPARSAP